MAHINGIGGIFIYSTNPKVLAEWYKEILEIPLKDLGGNVYYIELYYRSHTNSDKKLHTVFAIMPANEELGSTRKQAMINYRVDDLETFVSHLHAKGIKFDPIHEGEDAEGIGKFTHLQDLEGNRIELWQPSTGI